ncbi:uncharacterized protein RHO25_002270 [Cercospora beticola]|uniref:Secreted protein n=1 Tax=Cercospora beticola TaxID=122368 RepID=A0ABZ0NDS4_CERBT|nr:hypothetical protein RHO25_002270 [Cercospora beticola]
MAEWVRFEMRSAGCVVEVLYCALVALRWYAAFGGVVCARGGGDSSRKRVGEGSVRTGASTDVDRKREGLGSSKRAVRRRL